jgi:hypothetical protein
MQAFKVVTLFLKHTVFAAVLIERGLKRMKNAEHVARIEVKRKKGSKRKD